MQASDFLTIVWGDPPPGPVLIWTAPDKKSQWFRRFDDIDRVVARYEYGEVYAQVGMAPETGVRLTSGRRIKESQVAGIPAFWADVDVAHPVHKKASQLPPTIEDARAAIAELPLQPTLVVSSGHGLQCWWILESVWAFSTPEEREEARRLAQGWHHIIQNIFKVRGWVIDSVFDLTRLMRLPGTWNNKDRQDRRPVEVLEDNGLRYQRQQVAALIPTDFQPTPMTSQPGTRSKREAENSGTSSEFILDPNAEPGTTRMLALLKIHPKFKKTWEGERADLNDQSPSGYDFSLASMALHAGWPEQEVVNLLIAFRRKHGFAPKLRQNYFKTTIRNAKKPIETAAILQVLEDTANDPGQHPPDDSNRQTDGAEKLGLVSTLLGINISAVERFPGLSASYVLHSDQGPVEIASTEDLFNPAKVQVAIANATKAVVELTGPVKKRWNHVVRLMLESCVDRDLGDLSHTMTQVEALLEEYLCELGVHEYSESAMAERMPFMDEGRIRVHIYHLANWLSDAARDRNMNVATLGPLLRRLGAKNDPIDIKPKKNRTRSTYRNWVLPERFSEPFITATSEDEGHDQTDE